MGADRKANAWAHNCAPERGHGAPLEPLAQLDDALGDVVTPYIAKNVVEAAELGAIQAVPWEGEECQRALTRALTRKRTLWGGSALERLEHIVPLDAARDDDGGGDAQPLVREVNLLGRLCARELVNLKRVRVDSTKQGERHAVSVTGR